MSTTITKSIPLDQIIPNPEQPRQTFDEDTLQGLARSLREEGLIQPIVVERVADEYILHDGERRWRAAKLAGWDEIMAIINESPAGGDDDITRRARLTRALVANIQREDLNSMDIARAYQKMHDLGLSDQQIADRTGDSRSGVANRRRLLNLPDDVQQLALQGVPERQLVALLPLYQLPQATLDHAEKSKMLTWNKPSNLVQAVKNGRLNSAEIRDRVKAILKSATFPLDVDETPFDLDRHYEDLPLCAGCPERIRRGGAYRCPNHECYEAKTEMWKSERLAAASQATGIPIIEDDIRWGEYEFFYDTDLVRPILAEASCENLRLKFASGSTCARLADFPDILVMCHHGQGEHCQCLKQARSERTRNDPERIAARQRKQTIQNDIISPAATILAQHLADDHAPTWRILLNSLTRNVTAADWDTNRIRERIARQLIDNRLYWIEKSDMDAARQAVQALFDEAGISLPTPDHGDPTAALRHRLDRIQGWLGDLLDLPPTLDQVRGNLANLERIADEFDALMISNDDSEPFLQDMAEAWKMLHSLQQLLADPAWDPADFEHISWLTTVPPGAGNFKSHLADASSSAIRYALIFMDGRDGHKTRVQALQRQLAVCAQTVNT